jgi:hypothetical protein
MEVDIVVVVVDEQEVVEEVPVAGESRCKLVADCSSVEAR